MTCPLPVVLIALSLCLSLSAPTSYQEKQTRKTKPNSEEADDDAE